MATNNKDDFGFVSEEELATMPALPALPEDDFGFVSEEDFGFVADAPKEKGIIAKSLDIAGDVVKELPTSFSIGRDIAQGEFIPGVKRKAESFVAGLAGEPAAIPETPQEFFDINIPQSLGGLVAGGKGFIEDVGKLAFNVSKTATDPAFVLATTGDFGKAGEAFKRQGKLTLDDANRFSKDLITFVLSPTGVNPFPEDTEVFSSLENFKAAWGENIKQAYLANPAGTLAAIGMGAGGIAKGRAPGARPIPKAPFEGKVGEGFTTDIGQIGVPEAPLRGQPIRPARAEAVVPEAAPKIALEGPVGVPKAPLLIEGPKAISAVEAQIKTIDTLISEIREVGEEIGTVLPKRKGILQIPTAEPTPAISAAKIFEVQRELNKLDELRKTAEAATGQGLRQIYDPAIRDALAKLPEDARIILEREQAKAPIQPVTAIGPGRGPEVVRARPRPTTVQPVSISPKTGASNKQLLSAFKGTPTEKTVQNLIDNKAAGSAYYRDFELVSIKDIKPFLEFERETVSKRFTELRDDIKKNGIIDAGILFYDPKTNNAILGEGNHRVRVAQELGIKFVPIRVVRSAYGRDIGKPVKGVIKKVDELGFPQHIPAELKPSDIGIGLKGKDVITKKKSLSEATQERASEIKNEFDVAEEPLRPAEKRRVAPEPKAEVIEEGVTATEKEALTKKTVDDALTEARKTEPGKVGKERRKLSNVELREAINDLNTIEDFKNLPLEVKQELALTDVELTGLPNRLAFELTPKEGKTIAFVDAEGLKFANDSIGEAMGDALLRNIADVAASEAQGKVKVFRRGGDEFGIVSDFSDVGTRRVLERINERLKDTEITAKDLNGVDRTFKGFQLNWGIGKDLASATKAESLMKSDLQSKGLRAKRGEAPAALEEVSVDTTDIVKRVEAITPEEAAIVGEEGPVDIAKARETAPLEVDSTLKAEQSTQTAHDAAITSNDLAEASRVRTKFEDFLRTIDRPTEDVAQRIFNMRSNMITAESILRENPPEPVRRAQKRQLREVTEGGITREQLDAGGKENLSMEDASSIENLGLLDDLALKSETAKTPLEIEGTQITGNDAIVLAFFRKQSPENATALYKNTSKRGKQNILDEINRDPELYDELNGDTKEARFTEFLTDEGGFIDFGAIVDKLKGLKEVFGVDILPRLSKYSDEVVNKSVEHGSVKAIAETDVNSMIAEVFKDSEAFKNPEVLSFYKDLMNKDNVLDLYDSMLKKAKEAEVAGDRDKALAWYEGAKQITEKHDLAAYDREARMALNDATIVDNMSRFKDTVNDYMDKLYAETKDWDPSTELDGRGKYFGVRTNLVSKELGSQWKEYIESEETVTPEFAPSGNYRNPNVKLDPFDTAAKGTGDYSTDMIPALTAVVAKRLNEVTKIRLYKQLIKDGVAIDITETGKVPETIKGEPVTTLPITLPKTDATGKTRQLPHTLAIPREVAREITDVLNTQMRAPSSIILRALNAIQLKQAVDAIYHTRNQVLLIGRAQGAGSVWTDIQRKFPGFGSADAVRRLIQVANEVEADGVGIRKELSSMSRLGAVRTEYPHYLTPKFVRKYLKTAIDKADVPLLNKLSKEMGRFNVGKVIYKIDTASRVIMNRFYSDLVKRGLKPDTVTSRREYLDQVGQYNRRLMGFYMRTARDIGIAPFVVAGKNFNTQGVRSITGKPGGRVLDRTAELKLRFINWMGIVLTFSTPMMLNMLTVGTPMGRPGTKPGEWDLGQEPDEKNKHKTLDLAQLSLIGRGMRLTGLDALVDGVYEGRNANEIIGQAMDDSKRSLIHPWTGPGTRFMMEGAFGWDVEEFKSKHEPLRIPEGGIMQTAENFRASAEALNPPIYSLIRPTMRDIGIDRKPIDEETSFKSEMLKAPIGAIGLRDRPTPAYSEAGRMLRNRGIKTAETAEQAVVRSLRNSLQGKGDEEHKEILQNAINERIVDVSAAERIFNKRDFTPLMRIFDRLSVKAPIFEAVKVWEKMADEEKAANAFIMERKLENAWSGIPAEDKIAEQEFLDGVIGVRDDMIKMLGGEPPTAPDSITQPVPEEFEDRDRATPLGEQPQAEDLSPVDISQVGIPKPEKVSISKTENTPPTALANLGLGIGSLVKEAFPLAFPSEARKIAELPPRERQARAAGASLDLVIPLEAKSVKVLKNFADDIKVASNSIKSWMKSKLKLKDEEIRFLNIDELGKGKKSVSVGEIKAHVGENVPKINTIRKAGTDLNDEALVNLRLRANELLTSGEVPQNNTELSEILTQIDNMEGRGGIAISPTKFSSSKAIPEGGSNYRENLYQLDTPSIKGESFEDWFARTQNIPRNKSIEVMENEFSIEELTPLRAQFNREVSQIETPTFTGGHWDEPNVISHSRVDDRVDVEGKAGTLVQEIQSDWHSAARKQREELNVDLRNLVDEDHPWVLFINGEEVQSYTVKPQPAWIQDEINLFRPDAPITPFKDWHEFTMKNVLNDAVAKGDDRVYWATGEQTKGLYDLSKHLTNVTASPAIPDAGRPKYVIQFTTKQGDRHTIQETLFGEELPNYVGKDLGQKIIDDVGKGKQAKVYSDLDLKIGGEWADNLYDRMIPQFMKKQGGRVGKVEIKTIAKPEEVLGQEFGGPGIELKATKGEEEVWYMDITPSVKKKVEEGLDLFVTVPVGAGKSEDDK